MAETVTCPSCQRKLQVPEQYLGQKVQCPECRHMFVATTTTVSAQPMAPPAVPASKPAPRPRYEDDDDDVPIRRRRYDGPDDDDDFEFDDIRNRRGGRFRGAPHRGGLIMALGLIALVGGMSFFGVPFLLGPVAWLLGTWDLREMREGRMDPDGIGLTQAGQVCGIVASVLLFVAAGCIGFVFLSGMG